MKHAIILPLLGLILVGSILGLAISLDENKAIKESQQNIVYYDCIVTMNNGKVFTIETSTAQDYWFVRTWPRDGLRMKDKDGMNVEIIGNITCVQKRIRKEPHHGNP